MPASRFFMQDASSINLFGKVLHSSAVDIDPNRTVARGEATSNSGFATQEEQSRS
jgi:hypothetical protein